MKMPNKVLYAIDKEDSNTLASRSIDLPGDAGPRQGSLKPCVLAVMLVIFLPISSEGFLGEIINGLNFAYTIYKDLYRKEPPPKADIKLIQFDITPCYLENVAKATITIFNEGETTAEECSVRWYTHGASHSPVHQSVHAFGIAPNNRKTVNLQSFTCTCRGQLRGFAVVICKNARSDLYYRNLTIHPFIKAPFGPYRRYPTVNDYPICQ